MKEIWDNMFFGYNMVDFYVIAEKEDRIVFLNNRVKEKGINDVENTSLVDLVGKGIFSLVQAAKKSNSNLSEYGCEFFEKQCHLSVFPGEVTMIILTEEEKPEETDEDKMLYDLAMTVTNAMRAPLSGMYQTIDLMKSEVRASGSGGVFEKYISMLDRNFYQLYHIADNTNGLAKLSESYDMQNYAANDIIKVCKNIIGKAGAAYDILNIPVGFESAYEELVFSFDAELIERMIFNLLSNCAVFTRDGNRVTVKVTAVKTHCYITVADKGAGVPYDKMLEIVSEDPKKIIQAGWLYTGFKIVKRIAQLHGGSIVIEAREGEGTTVTASLSRISSKTLKVEQPSMKYEMSGGFPRVFIEMANVMKSDEFALLTRRIAEMETDME